MTQYHLHIEHFTQNLYSGDPETPVAPNQIDAEKNLHVYLTGNISTDRSVKLLTVRLSAINVGKKTDYNGGSASNQEYKASLPHYTLASGSDYLLKAVDDPENPWAIASHKITTT